MTWAAAVSPDEPQGHCDLVAVDDALLTPFTRAPLRASHGPRTWMKGAVHDREGTLVPSSQRFWAGDPFVPAAGDPDQVRIPQRRRNLEGTWLYVGHWASHFGHFVVETLTNLWPDPTDLPDPLMGLVAHRSHRGEVPVVERGGVPRATLEPWHHDLLRLAGYGDLEVRVVRARAAQVERLLVPGRPVLLKSWALPPAVALWNRVSDAVGDRGPHRRVFLSRTLFHMDHPPNRHRVRTRPRWDSLLDEQFARAGFEVVHPERLSITEQIALVRGADVLAGPSGSALHLSAFARRETRVLEVGDERSTEAPMPSQQAVDAACGHLTAFVGYGDETALRAVLDGLDDED